MNVLDSWILAACKELGIDPAEVDRSTVLDLARDVAHGVARPAAPLTAYLLGIAVGGGQSPEDTAERLRQLAAGWTADPANADPANG
jgi:hypothetical protein